MKIYMRLDKQSIPKNIRNNIRTNNNLLIPLDDDISVFIINPIEFTHAYLLLAESSTRFGNDLQLYLATVNAFLRNVNDDALLTLGFGDSDFKRRVSEDLAVGLSSLFMVKSFSVAWQTIAQIPHNKKLSRFRPDFEGFANGTDRFLWESKGRTKLGDILNAIDKAIKQVKDYPEQAIHKFAIVTYFSTDERAFPSQSFVIDPQLPDIIPPNLEAAKYLHYIKVLEFSGMFEVKKAYVDFLILKFRKDLSFPGTDSWQYKKKIEGHLNLISQKIDGIGEEYEEINVNNNIFLCRTIKILHEGNIYSIKLGLLKYVLRNLALGTLPHLYLENFLNSEEGVSIFSDGTYLNITIERS